MSDMPSDKTETAAPSWVLIPQNNLRKAGWLRGESLTLESGIENLVHILPLLLSL